MQEKISWYSSAEECSENIDEIKIAEITLAGHENVCICSCTIYVVLIPMIFAISIGIGVYFTYSRWYLKKDITRTKSGTRTQTTI